VGLVWIELVYVFLAHDRAYWALSEWSQALRGMPPSGHASLWDRSAN
jgi:hypothetical protein